MEASIVEYLPNGITNFMIMVFQDEAAADQQELHHDHEHPRVLAGLLQLPHDAGRADALRQGQSCKMRGCIR